MFPNPQAALPFPPKPNVERYKKLAKELVKAVKAYKSGNTSAIDKWVENWIEGLARLSTTQNDLHQIRSRLDREIDDVEEFVTRQLCGEETDCRLADAQFVIARSHGFQSWPRFLKHLGALSSKTSLVGRFEAAIDAIVIGDSRKLKRLLREDSRLVTQRSTREHGATLLHYVSANGVEGYRQKSPGNVVEIAKILLDAGAEVDAEADVYGGGATTLGLVGTSVHPFLAGVQNPLMQLLLDRGAEIKRPQSAGNKSSVVVGCLANGRGEAAVYLAEHGAPLDLVAAAGVGRLDIVASFFKTDGALKRTVSRKNLELAFLYACSWGRNNVVEFLLKKGVNLKVENGDGQTAMHRAAIGGQLETIKLLLKHKPPLEARNVYGGTVLGQTLWSAAHGGNPEVYTEIIETLLKAGAQLPTRHVPVNGQIDDLLRRYGSDPEPTWYWFGEKPRRK